jgi:hypothetical protein
VFGGHKLYTNCLSLCTYVMYSKRLPALDGEHMQMNAKAVWLLLLCFRQHSSVECLVHIRDEVLPSQGMK